jgi:hypothetical protein
MNPRASENPAPWRLVLAALVAGLVLGLCGWMWQPVEERLLDGGLVLAGQVTYPPDALMGLYYKGVWTILYQLGALALGAGASYSTANLFFQLIPPALFTAAFALFVHGLTGRPWFSFAVAVLCFINGFLVLLFESSDYPLLGISWNMSSPHSYGRFGAVLAAFAFAALVGGRDALAAFTAAVLISVHPVIGTYVTVLLTCGWGVARVAWNRPVPRGVFAGFAAGLCITLASLAVWLMHRPAMPAVDPAANAPYLEIYSSFWDDHRNRTSSLRRLLRVLVMFVLLSAPLWAFLVLRRGRRGSADAGAVALLFATAAATVLYILQHWGQAFLPEIGMRAIPGRLLNMQAPFMMALLAAVVVFVADEMRPRRPARLATTRWAGPFFRSPNAVALGVVLVMAVRFLPGFVQGLVTTQRDAGMIAAREATREIDSPFWSKVRALRIDRVVLTAPELSLKGLRYGRLPVALDTTAIDFIPYLPQTATLLGTLVERGYGVDFFHPPQVFKFTGALKEGSGRDYWACLSPAQWRPIARSFDVAALLVPANWKVRLPLLLSDANYALYAMPTGAPDANALADPPCPLWRG